MAKGFLYGTGGADGGLNFRIFGGKYEPLAPRENDIFVNTTENITGWAFGTTEPTNKKAGMVWFPTSISSPVAFNALKNNGIQIHPAAAKQYIGGAWVNQAAKSYRGGVWVDWWNGVLYDNGNRYEDFTGGFGVYAHRNAGSTANAATPYVTFNAASVALSLTYSVYQTMGVMWAEKAVDLTQYKTLNIDVTSTSQANICSIIISGEKSDGFTAIASKGIAGAGKTSVDVSAFNGLYYICVALSGNQANLEFTKLWLE